MLGHSQTKGRDNREPKLRPKPARQSSTLLPNGRGSMRPESNSSKPSHRSRPSPSNAASAMPNACGAHFNGLSKSVRTTTGRGFDQSSSPEFYDRAYGEARP